MSDATTTPTDAQVVQQAARDPEDKLNPEPRPDEPQTLPEDDETPEGDEDTPEADEGAEKAKAAREAAKYRRQAREAQAERDAAVEHVAELQKGYVVLMLKDQMKRPADFGRYVPFENLLADDGKLDPTKIDAEVKALLRSRPELAIPGPTLKMFPRPAMGRPEAASSAPSPSPTARKTATEQLGESGVNWSDVLNKESEIGDGLRASSRKDRVNLSSSEG